MAIVVIGHWLISAVTFHDGEFGNDYPLAIFPWAPWLTLVFQVVPVFFLVGGYASATAWLRWQEVGGHRWPDWVRQRVGALLGPTTAYVVLVLATIAVLSKVGVGRAPLSFGGWAVAMHLWFIPVYLVVVALTPVAVAAHRQWGLAVPAVLALAVAVVDAVARSVPEVGPANYLLCWAAVYQIGICWRGGQLRGRRTLLCAVSAAILVAVLLALRCYPISMVGAPGAAEQNNFPPTVALLAFAVAQTGLLVAAAPAVTRWLQRSRWRRLLAVANKNVMAIYLWRDGARRRRRAGRLSDGLAPPAQAGKRGVVAVSGGVAGDPGFGVGGGTGAAVVGAGALQSGVAHVRHRVARVEYDRAADRRHRCRDGCPCSFLGRRVRTGRALPDRRGVALRCG